jgi:ATP-dependent DNA helicase RecG
MINPDLIKQGQGPRMAYLVAPDPNSIAETLVAFANTEGGMIVIGLQADGTQADNTLNVDVLQQAMKKADDLCNPPVVVDKWEEIQLTIVNGRVIALDLDDDFDNPNGLDDEEDDAPDALITPGNLATTLKTGAVENNTAETKRGFTVFAMRVPRSVELHALSDGRVLIRTGDKNRPLGGQEILRLASAKSSGDFEAEVVPGASKEDFSRDMIEEYLTKRAERTKRPYNGKVDELLREIGAITAEGKPTVAGILLFSEYPQQWLPQSSVVFAKFVGTTPRGESGLAGYTRREELTGPLPRLIEASWNLIWSEMAVSAVVKGLEREEKTEYPQFAVREAIVNAICHRDYRLRGRRIELRMYSDRLEVISPGGLPGFITVENIKDEHFSRNPRIVNGLFQWGYIEELGLGIDRMLEVMEQAGHQPPNFDARPYSFAVTLSNERQKPKPPEWMRNTNHRQAKALQYIRENGSITNREYRHLCEGISAETLRLDLADMVEKSILMKVGSKKGTHYILK